MHEPNPFDAQSVRRAYPGPLRLGAFAPGREVFLAEVLEGLRKPQKELPCKYFYDERGAWLFERICDLPEYYLTRAELEIMEAHGAGMAALLGAGCCLVEFGSGASRKTRVLLDYLPEPATYVPVDISREQLVRTAADLAAAYPGVEVLPVCADFTKAFELPRPTRQAARRAVYFPGSTIGNFGPPEARGLLARVAGVVGRDGALLIGVDLAKEAAFLEPAYDDAEGVTREFNLNLLARVNRELAADFRLDRFRHLTFYNEWLGRVEMHLVSLVAQTVRVAGQAFSFDEGETIHTECSYKYSLERFRELAVAAGFDVARVWTDRRGLFSVQYLVAR